MKSLKVIAEYIFIKKAKYSLINLMMLLVGCAITYFGNTKHNTIIVAIGTSIIAAGIVAMLDIWREISNDKTSKQIQTIILDGGLESIYRKRDLDEYDELINNVRENLDISGYSLRGFMDSYKEIILSKCSIQKDLKIRIMLVDPKSMFSQEREKIENNGNCRGLYESSMNNIYLAFKDLDNVEIRTINAQLTTMIYRIDKVLYIGPHFYKKSSKSTVTYKINEGGWLFAEYMDEFDRMWKDGIDIYAENQ